MSRLTQEQVLALAPDQPAAAAAQELANPAKWPTCGVDETAVWGEAKGSGSRPYQTAVDLRNIAYKCTCPSRKLPCKHALGLLLRLANGEIVGGEQPLWVSEWLERRSERATKQAAPPAVPDPEASAKRTEKRWNKILAGLDECEAFLSDAVSQGLLAVQSARSWNEMAARMIDAQAPGVAGRLKQIGAGIGVGDKWPREITAQLGRLTLLIEAARRADSLDANLAADVRTALGIPSRKEDLDTEKVIDTWDVVGQTTEVEDRLTTCRSWLRSRSGRWAMHLAFSVAGQPFDFQPIPGTALAAEVQFYPSAWPLRVALGEKELVHFRPIDGTDWAVALDTAATAWSKSPWVDLVPVLLHAAQLGSEDGRWFAIDESGDSMPVKTAEMWEVLGLSGNQPSELFGEWDGRRLKLLSAWGDLGFTTL
jgi:hypothetical protein